MPDLALVGGGYWGKNLARNFLQLGALHTLCDSNAQTLNAYDRSYEHVRRSHSFEEVLSDETISKIAIATPAVTHYEFAKKALDAGKHVYVEKPLCLSIVEGQELISLAEKNNRVLMVGHLLQYHPCVIKLREMVRNGDLGKLYYITSNRLNLGKIRSEENALWSFAPHDISVILGLSDQLPSTVQCTGEHYLTKGVADTTLTQMTFSNGLRAHVFVSWLNPFKEQKLTVIGSNGMAVFDDTKPWQEKLVVYSDYLTWESGQIPVAKKINALAIEMRQEEPLLNECDHFIKCCEENQRPLTDGREGLNVLKVLDAAQRSLELKGQSVEIAPLKARQYFLHETSIVDEGAAIGSGSAIWHYSHVSSQATLGNKCNVGQNVFIAPGVTIGNNVKIQNNVSIYTGTTIEDDVFLGPSCVLTNVSNPRSQVNRKSVYESTVIKRGATIGANATIVCGVTLGRYSFVAAGAVVTKDIPDYSLVKGSPARHAGWMSRHGHPLEFDATGVASCPESNLRYELTNYGGKIGVRCISLPEDLQLPIELANGKQNYRSIQKNLGK